MARQMQIDWHNFLKGWISKKWQKLWSKTIGQHQSQLCERHFIHELWNHSYHIWEIRNKEEHKEDNKQVAKYKQHTLNS
jgi:hypothetical protein